MQCAEMMGTGRLCGVPVPDAISLCANMTETTAELIRGSAKQNVDNYGRTISGT